MLTVRQLLFLSLPVTNPSSSMHAKDLLGAFKAHSVSIRSAINAVQDARVAYCVELRTTDALLLKKPADALYPPVNTLKDLRNIWNDPIADISKQELSAVYKGFKSSGIYMGVLKNEQTAVLVGTNGALCAVQAIPLTDQNIPGMKLTLAASSASTKPASAGSTVKPLDGGGDIAGGLGILGAALMVIATVPEPASPIIYLIGAGISGAAAGYLFGTGVNQLKQDAPNPAASPNDTQFDQPDGDAGSLPDGTVYGETDGIDSQQLAESIVNLALDGLPDDFNTVDPGTIVNGITGGVGVDGGAGDGGGVPFEPV